MSTLATLRTWPGWPQLRRWAPWALAALVLVLLARQAHTLDWPAVAEALRQQSPARLAAALALALLSHALFASYDLIGRRLTGHRVGRGRTLRIAAIAYAFNLNFGSLVGAFALRLRLYTRAGLDLATTARVIGTGLVTNWLGYLLLGGAVLALQPPPLPPWLPLSDAGVRVLGVAMLLPGAAYLAACTAWPRRRFSVRGHAFELPSAGIALWQAGVSALNWALMGTLVWLLLAGALPWPTVLAVLLLAAVAGLATHVPAGLGVLEAVFVASLGAQVPAATLLAALLAYRAAYYLVPLAAALAAYGLSETGSGGNTKTDAGQPAR